MLEDPQGETKEQRLLLVKDKEESPVSVFLVSRFGLKLEGDTWQAAQRVKSEAVSRSREKP